MNDFRVPIMREVDDIADSSDPDHIRGAKYANLLFGTDYGKGDVVDLLYVERVRPEFCTRIESERPALADDPLYIAFKRNPGVICVGKDDNAGDLLPDEFELFDEQPPKVVDR